MNDYTKMWEDLGLDVKAHDGLLSFLGGVYQDLFLSQKNRPEGMKYFDSAMGGIHGARIQELQEARAAGRKVVGSYCTFVPEELIIALDGIAVGLCSGAEWAPELVDQVLPRNTCALIKSAFGFKLGRVCPYVEACDLIVGENTCDGKKKAYEILRQYVPDLYVIDLPQMKSEAGTALLRTEYGKFAARLEELTGRKLTAENLRAAIATTNAKRRALMRLAALRAAEPAPISGLDCLLIAQISFCDDPVRFTGAVEALCDELEQRIARKEGAFPAGTPRVVLSGCPMAVPNWKVPAIVEGAGAVIVAEESCVGERSTRWLAAEEGKDVAEMIAALAERYLRIDCAVFTPNPSRLEHVRELSGGRKADGVIHYALQFCQPYQMEAGPLQSRMEKESVPTLCIDTDYSQEDVGQIRTRVEAFVERIRR